ncbi:hypothetical protein V3C99_008950 [Haemonchus contortus]
MPLITPRNRRSGGPDALCGIVLTVGSGRLLTGSLRMSNDARAAVSAMVRLPHKSSKRQECCDSRP